MQVDRGLRLGRPLGFPLVVHVSWLPAVALLIAHFAVTTFSPFGLLPAAVLGCLAALGVFGSVLFHEAAHVVIARGAGLEIDTVVLHLTGGATRYARQPERPGQMLMTALVGPVASGALGVGALVLTSMAGPPLSDLVLAVGTANIGLALLNLLPGLPFDGGQVLWAGLWASGAARYRAMAAAARWGQVITTGTAIAGLWLFWTLPLNGGAAAGLLLAVVAATSWPQATAVRRAARVTGAVDGRVVVEWSRPFDGRVRIDDRVPKKRGVYAVADDGRLAGVVVGGRRLGRKRVESAMVPWRPELCCAEDAGLAAALAQMSSAKQPMLVVLGEDGVVRGVLHSSDVSQRLGGR